MSSIEKEHDVKKEEKKKEKALPEKQGWFWNKKKPNVDEIETFEIREKKNDGQNQVLPPLAESLVLENEISEKEMLEVSMTKELVTGYFGIVKKRLCDIVPKVIINGLVNKIMGNS